MIRLTKREKYFAAGLSAFALLWSLFAFAINPAKERIATLKRVLPQKQAELNKLSAAAEEYALLSDSRRLLLSKVASQGETFELLPFLESLIRKSGLEKNVAKMQQRVLPLGTDYSQTVVEMELNGLSLERIVDFLQKIESSDVLARTGSLYIKKSRTKKNLLDTVITIHNPKLAQIKVARH